MLYARQHERSKAVNSFTLYLQAATQHECIEGVSSLIAEDVSGCFGILAGHERLVTTLVPGLARFRRAQAASWEYVAVAGAVLYFAANELFINTRRYLRGGDYATLSTALQSQLMSEEENLQRLRQSLHRMEEAMFKRLWQLENADR
jgi:F-type H+-transporting ATPase subunit epsilon